MAINSLKPIVMTCMIGFFLAFQASATTFHVKPTGDNKAAGTNWATAFMTVQKVLTVANSSVEIWVAAGTSKSTAASDRNISFVLINGMTFYGDFVGNELPSSDMILRIYIFTDNFAKFSGGGLYIVFSSGPSVINCKLTSYSASEGGGMPHIAQSSPNLTNCVFIGNHGPGKND